MVRSLAPTACGRVLDTEPKIALDGCSIGVSVCVNVRSGLSSLSSLWTRKACPFTINPNHRLEPGYEPQIREICRPGLYGTSLISLNPHFPSLQVRQSWAALFFWPIGICPNMPGQYTTAANFPHCKAEAYQENAT